MVDVLIRNVDKDAYKLAKMIAVKEDVPVGRVVSQAIQVLAAGRKGVAKKHSAHLPTVDLGPGSRNLSREIDDVLYG